MRGGILKVFESGETGELTEVASLGLPHAHEGVAVTDDDSRVFTLGAGGAAVVDVEDPTRPVLLGVVRLPQASSWTTPVCGFATARVGRPAADAFCTNGDAYALEWRDGKLAVTDIVADWRGNRFNDAVPDFGIWVIRSGFAASLDGRHAYTSTPQHGIAVFERVNNAVDRAPMAATVTIAADASPVTEGTPADFTLTRSDSTGLLTVNVDIVESGAMIAGTAPTTVTFSDGAATAALIVATEDDGVDEPDSIVTATVAAGARYAPGAPASASVTVTDDDTAPAPVSFAADRAIATDADGARAVHAADLDGDGDPDVVTASFNDDKVAWHENLGGGAFATARVLTTNADGAVFVHAADLDGDGDADVLSASRNDDKIAWHENLGNGAFSAQRVLTTDADGAHSVHAADLDGDGDADVLSASRNDDKIAWHENLGGGAFSAQRVISTDADRPWSVHAADLDGDGDADVLSASENDDKIAWHENLGDGAFSAQRVLTTAAAGAVSVHAADLDGDGDADVLSASRDDDKIAWHENLGGGGFSSQRVLTTDADDARSVYTADLDGDGLVEVLSASYADDKIAWHENLGRGRFSAQKVLLTSADGAQAVHAADLDGDGDPDVLSASYTDNRIAWVENLTNHGDDHGDAPASATLATALPAFLHGTLETAGDRDLFRIATAGGTLRVYANGPTNTHGWLLDEEGEYLAGDDPSSGNFIIEAEVGAGVHYVQVFGAVTGSYTLSIEFVAGDGTAVADDHGDTPATATALPSLPWFGSAQLDGTTDRDVFRIDVPEPGTLTAYTTDAGGGADTYGVLTDANGVVLAEDDDSGDGANFEIEAAVDAGIHYIEVRGVAGRGYYFLFIELAVADGTTVAIGAQQVITTDADGATAVYAADLDNDGDADVLTASWRDDTIAWHENMGGGRFSTQQVITTDADGVKALYAADLDGDGDADVLSASYDDDRVVWYENLGGAFASGRTIATEFPGFVAVHAADLDGDGDADVLGMSGNLGWYENTGDQEFSGPQRISGAGGSGGRGSVHAADLDGDGRQDILATEGHAGIRWYENLGGGSFSRREISRSGDVVYAADLDVDGDADVLVATTSSNVAVVTWYENLGGGEFSAGRPITTLARGGQSVHAADLDGDGDMDVLSASGYDGKIAWYSNRGDGSFLGQQVIAVSNGAESVHAADLDGDGDPDVLSASQGDNTIAWYENLSDHGDDYGDAPDSASLAATLPALLLGRVESDGDKDVFRVATGNGTLSVNANGPTDTVGRLLDADGVQLAANDDSDGLNFGIEAEVAAGIHYVEVGAYAANTGPYTLSIEFKAD
ncbi:MAG: FG-GAP-like repeat-containing protein [Gammaproteobacteria bacterium]|nr:FG-GAP-like repeat-containing protein [Gammaproteobacteria bacterium]